METPHGKTVKYWKENAEEDYMTTPISVLKYITILEEQFKAIDKPTTFENKPIPCEEWTREQLEELPSRGWNEDIGEFDSLIILHTDNLHESGYRCMDFVAVRGAEPFCRLSGCSDIIHLDGIGGYGEWEFSNGTPTSIKPKGWQIDCLKESGLLRIYSDGKLKAGQALSSFDLYSNK